MQRDEAMQPASASAAAAARAATAGEDDELAALGGGRGGAAGPREHPQPEYDEPSAARARAVSPAQARAQKQRGVSSRTSSAQAEAAAVAMLWQVVHSASLTWDRRLRWTHTVLAFLGLLNFLVVIVLFQACWDSHTLHFGLNDDCPAFVPMQLIGSGLWLAFFITLVIYYRHKAGFKALIGHYHSRWAAFTNSGLMRSFCLEALASLVQPFPVLHLTMDLTHAQWLVILALVCKIYLLIRLLRDHSAVYQQRMFLKQNTRYDTSYYAMDYLTVAKTYVFNYTLWVVVIGCSLNAFFMAYLLHICERELWLPRDGHQGALPRRFNDLLQPQLHGGGVHEHKMGGFVGPGSELLASDAEGAVYFQSPYVSFLNCIYFVGIVATTTGLGDIAPTTEQGKMFAVATALMGVVWSGFGVGVLTNKLVPSDFQAYCIDAVQRTAMESDKQRLAATLIQRCWRLHKTLEREEAKSGRPIPPPTRAERFVTALSHLVRKFQEVQRQESNLQFVYSSKEGAHAPEPLPTHHHAALNVGSTGNSPVAGDVRVRGTTSNSSVMRLSADAASPSSTALSPLTQSKHISYGTSASSDADASGSLLRRSGSERKSRSMSSGNGRPSPPEISAERAVRALHYLNRPSRGDSAEPAGVRPGGGGGGSGSPVDGRTRSPSYRSSSISGGYSAQSAALANLAAQNAALSASLRGLEAKVDQILQATSRAGVHENMLEGGHVFASWTSNGRAGVQEDALVAPMLLWLERDDTKYGSLCWTTDEFCVHARLRIKVPGQSFPLHSITDVLLGKNASVFSLPAAERVPPTLCFTVASKAYARGLNLQAQFQEERTLWISQLKQAFLQRRVPTTASGSSTPSQPGTPGGPRSAGGVGDTPGHHRSGTMAISIDSGAAARQQQHHGSARRASESMAVGVTHPALQQQAHGRTASHFPSSALLGAVREPTSATSAPASSASTPASAATSPSAGAVGAGPAAGATPGTTAPTSTQPRP